MKISMEIPFFPGFYETDLMNSDTSYWAIKEELEYYYQQDLLPEHPEYVHLTEDDLDFRYSDYEKDVDEAFLEVWENRAPEAAFTAAAFLTSFRAFLGIHDLANCLVQETQLSVCLGF